ncbi:hypothetical protein N0V90_010216 [Kalmusia sp. IMI 367209]|nr:hypothetical protein N0V90_010216 [Kalmusia sp. IMI 367209]
MVKSNRYPSRIPEWTKLEQYKEQSAKFNEVNDVEMEGIEIALEEKLVLPRGLRRKRSRTDSMFGTIEESPIKRIRAPESRKVDSEAIPAFRDKLTILVKDDQGEGEVVPLQVDREKALSGNSEYISATLMSEFISDWKSALPKPIDLTDEDPSLIKHYLKWMKIRKIDTQDRPRWASAEEKSRSDYKEEMTLDTEHLAHCYGLGERLEDAKYRNAILHVIRDYALKEKLFPSDFSVAAIYKGTKKGSPARKMMVDFWAYTGSATWLESDSIRDSICSEFLEDLVPALLRVRARPEENERPWVKNIDAYCVEENETQPEDIVVPEQESMEMQE